MSKSNDVITMIGEREYSNIDDFKNMIIDFLHEDDVKYFDCEVLKDDNGYCIYSAQVLKIDKFNCVWRYTFCYHYSKKVTYITELF